MKSRQAPAPAYQWSRNGSPNAGAPNALFTVAAMAAGNAGSYFVRLTNIIGQADSRTASIGYSADTTSPTIFQALGGHVSTRVFVAFSEPVNVGLPGGARQRLRTLVDDGAIFYLNGQEVLRLRTPNGPVDCATFANVSQGDAANIFEGPYELPAAALIGGTNVFAVEVHQANAASSDVSFAAQLFLDLPVLSFPSPALTALRDTGGATLLWSGLEFLQHAPRRDRPVD